MLNYEPEEEEVQDKVQDKFPEVSTAAWKVFDVLRQNPKATVSLICEQLNLKERQVYKHISLLKSVGVIARVGSNKTGYWKITIE